LVKPNNLIKEHQIQEFNLFEKSDEDDHYQSEFEQHIPACGRKQYSLDCMNSAHKDDSAQDHYRENIYHEKIAFEEDLNKVEKVAEEEKELNRNKKSLKAKESIGIISNPELPTSTYCFFQKNSDDRYLFNKSSDELI
jgi:Ca2+-dependent lipid-binding protein